MMGGIPTENQRVFDLSGIYSFTLPPEAQRVHFKIWGAGGGGGNQSGATGGGGAYIEFGFNLTGETNLRELTLWVGEGGQGQGKGGGGSFIWSQMMDDLVLLGVAGGGGGGGSDGNSGNSWSGGKGGAGGWTFGQDGEDLGSYQGVTPYAYCTSAEGGHGGTQEAGGQGGIRQGTSYGCDGVNGGQYVGGSCTSRNLSENLQCVQNEIESGFMSTPSQGNGGGGGGGGGYYGGGSGGFIHTYCAGGGGGGSSWAAPWVNQLVYEEGFNRTQGRMLESNGAGQGGLRLDPSFDRDSILFWGEHGRIEVLWE